MAMIEIVSWIGLGASGVIIAYAAGKLFGAWRERCGKKKTAQANDAGIRILDCHATSINNNAGRILHLERDLADAKAKGQKVQLVPRVEALEQAIKNFITLKDVDRRLLAATKDALVGTAECQAKIAVCAEDIRQLRRIVKGFAVGIRAAKRRKASPKAS